MWRRWIWVGAYVGLIFTLSSIPNLTPPTHIHNADKVAHLLEYFILGTLLARGWMGSLPGCSARRAWLLAVLMGAVIAAFDELYQGTVAGRERSVADWTADLIGMTAGGGLVASGWLERTLGRVLPRGEGRNP